MASPTAIPIIDISGRGDEDQARVAKELVDAAVEYGFVYVRNKGLNISSAQVEQAFDISKTLFQSPLEDKQRCKIQKNNQGWSGMHTETLDPKTQRIGDFKEAFNFGTFAGKARQDIPQSIEPYERDIATFRYSCHTLCRRLLLLFGIGLGVDPPDYFTAAHPPDKDEASGSILRFLYYPPPSATPSAEEDDVRAGAHSDYGSITLLFRLRNQAGLEILTRTHEWAAVPVCPPGTEEDPSPPILVNIGDLLSYWTNGLLRSTVHRVTFANSKIGNGAHAAELVDGETTTDPRYSIVYFCHPADGTLLSAVPSTRVLGYHGGRILPENSDVGNPYVGQLYAGRKVLTAEQHLKSRLRATYLQMYGSDEHGLGT